MVTSDPQIGSIQFSWSQNELDVVESYTVRLDYLGPCPDTIEPLTGPPQDPSFTAINPTDLLSFSQYQFTVTATNMVGSNSTVVNVTTLPSGMECILSMSL